MVGFFQNISREWTRFLNVDVAPLSSYQYDINQLDPDSPVVHYLVSNYLFFQLVTRDDHSYPILFPYFFYSFPDEDFYMFVDFPADRLVIPLIKIKHFNFSCTFVWLFRYLSDISKIFDIGILSRASEFEPYFDLFPDQNQIVLGLNSCHIEKMTAKCNLDQVSSIDVVQRNSDT